MEELENETIRDEDLGIKEIWKGAITPRGAVKIVATHSVRFVVSSALTSLVPVESKKDRARLFVGSYVISGVINDKIKAYVDEEIDEKIKFFRGVMVEVKKLEAQRAEANDTAP